MDWSNLFVFLFFIFAGFCVALVLSAGVAWALCGLHLASYDNFFALLAEGVIMSVVSFFFGALR